MAWCPSDSSLLLSCAKDNQTLCWDTLSGQVLCELPASGNWNFDVQWSPCTPGVLSTSSFDGQIGIYNIEACSRAPSNHSLFGGDLSKNDYSTALTKAPKWLKRPVGVSFGFGGKLVSFYPKKGAPASSEVRIHSLITEEGLVKRSTEFEEAIAGGERSSMRNFCESKASAAGSEEERETWSLLRILFEEEARGQLLLSHFGFSVKPTQNGEIGPLEDNTVVGEEFLNLSLKDDSSSPNEDAVSAPVITVEETTLASADDGEDFFDKLEIPPTPTDDNGPSLNIQSNEEAHVTEQEAGDKVPILADSGESGADDESEAAIQRALVAGDFKAAVDHCLAANRMADALVIAGVGGAALWESTQNIYIQRTRRQRPYLKVLSAIINNDLQGLVDSRPLKAWKETLALIFTYAYAQSDQWTKLCDALGARLDAGHETYAATWCYICAGNVEKAVDIWARTLNVRNGGVDFVDLLQVRGGCSFKDHQKCRLAMHRWSLDCNAWLISEIT
jgi:protein transport protein SEC31